MEKSKLMGGGRKLDSLWDYDHGEAATATGGGGGGGGGVFPWPPRCYTCSFCKRQFRSAQALGGHMNIHRRDRARLRQLSPPPRDISGNGSFLNLNHEPNPNLNFNFNQNPNYCPSPFTSTRLPSLFPSSTPPPTPPTFSEIRGWGSKEGMISSRKATNFGKIRPTKRVLDHHHHHQQLSGAKDGKRSEFVRLELEIGLLGDQENQDLDLELRLGYT